MRKFTFGSFLIGHGSDYCIESVDGLSEPGIVWQEQKAPYQDGATYIDNLFDVREIVVEGSIVASTLSAINTAKDTMIRALNPKNGQAWLQYDADGVSKRIMAVGSVVFGNKDYQESFQKFQVTFRCGDPLWQDLTADSINLPTQATSNFYTLSEAVKFQTILERQNGNLFITYTTTIGGIIKSQEYNGSSWSSPVTIASAKPTYESSFDSRSIEMSNGNILLLYSGLESMDSVYKTKYRIYTGSWGSPIFIEDSELAILCLIELFNGTILAIVDDGINVQKKTFDGSSWSSSTTIIAKSLFVPSNIMQKTDGTVIISGHEGGPNYNGISYNYDYLNNVLSNKNTINVSGGTLNNYPIQLIELRSKTLIAIYWKTAAGPIVSRSLSNGVWSSESIIKSTGGNFHALLSLDGSLYILFSDRISVRKINPVNAAVTGHIGVSIKVTLNGPSTNPRIINDDTLEYIRLNKTLATGDYFVVNTEFGKKSIELWSGGIKTNGLAYLDLGSTLFQLSPGDNTVYYEDDAVASTATATMEWTERYIGV
jgi:hypothetical protein